MLDNKTTADIMAKARELIGVITAELNSAHNETTKAINITFNEGQIFGLLEVLRMSQRMPEYCEIAKEMKINEPAADETKNKLYHKSA